MKKQSGFTLIELMVVMAIIAILATAGLTAYSSYRKKARDSARAQIARQLMTKVEELANGGPTPTPAELVSFLATENATPVDPLSGQEACYGAYNGTYGAPCGFAYGTVSDGTYYISYSVEHPDNIGEAWVIYGADFGSGSPIEYTTGKIIGTNPYLIPANISLYDNYAVFSNTTFYPVAPTYEVAAL